MFTWSPARARSWLAASGGATLAAALAGALGAATLSGPLWAALHQTLSLYVGGLLSGGPAAPPAGVWRAAFGLDLRTAALAWAGGLFAFGWALTLSVLVAEGFAVGFAPAALAGAVPNPAAWLAAAFPALVAACLMAGLGAVALSLANRQRESRRGRHAPPTGTTYGAYAFLLVLAALGFAAVALLQAYGLPAALRLLAASPGLGMRGLWPV